MSDIARRVTLTPATPGDFAELAALRVAAMRGSLERIGRFDPDRARERLAKSFYPEHTRFILLDGIQAGFYTFRPVEDGYRLEHLYIHPDHQSVGLGSHILRQLLARSDALGVAVRLTALRGSEANHFYRRHGFVPTHEGEWDIHYFRPAPAAAEITV